MTLSPFHALSLAHDLSSFAFGNKQLVPVFASSTMEIYPFQVAAARFALRSPYLKGVILCDDGALGKSFEAMLVAIQRWAEGKSRILLIIPTPLLKQWSDLLNRFFTSRAPVGIPSRARWRETSCKKFSGKACPNMVQ